MEKSECGICSNSIAVNFNYRNHHGWLCEDCAPSFCDCKYKSSGCTFKDTIFKCLKHERYFCSYSTLCGICQQTIAETSMSDHFDVVHGEKSKRAGERWHASDSDEFLMWSACGIVVVKHTIFDKVLLLDITSSLTSEQLNEYECIVQLYDSVTGQNCNFPIKETYGQMRDWHLRVDAHSFPYLSGTLDAAINITKID